MAFGIKREELIQWKRSVLKEQIAILTHYWEDERFPGCTSVTKIGCANIDKLIEWGHPYKLNPNWVHRSAYPHFDVFGEKQKEVLEKEGMTEQLLRFNI